MGKLTLYLVVISGLVLLFHFTGLITECDDEGLCEGKTPNSALLDLLINPEELRTSTAFSNGILVLEGLLAATIIAFGVFTGNLELAVVGPFAIFFFNLGWDVMAVFNRIREVNPVLAILIFSPILLLYIVTIVEWWRGRD